jgi:hypothetical protein
MTKTMNHSNCPHPATKAARAKCRKAHAAAQATQVESLAGLVASYHEGADIEEIAGAACRLAPHAADGYYNNSLDAEEFIAALAKADREGDTPAPMTRRARRAAQFAEMRDREAALPKITRTPELDSAYTQYISDGLGATDGYYAPLDFDAWARTR